LQRCGHTATAAAAVAAAAAAAAQVDAYAELPYFMNPLLAACQLVNVSLPGSEPPLAAAQEDMRLFSPALCDKNGECCCIVIDKQGVTRDSALESGFAWLGVVSSNSTGESAGCAVLQLGMRAVEC
jgi:hypothetical protein